MNKPVNDSEGVLKSNRQTIEAVVKELECILGEPNNYLSGGQISSLQVEPLLTPLNFAKVEPVEKPMDPLDREAMEDGLEYRTNANGTTTWFKAGTDIKHRLRGPADAGKYWCFDGVQLSKSQHDWCTTQGLKPSMEKGVDIRFTNPKLKTFVQLHNVDGPAVWGLKGSIQDEYWIGGGRVSVNLWTDMARDWKNGVRPEVEEGIHRYLDQNRDYHRISGPAFIEHAVDDKNKIRVVGQFWALNGQTYNEEADWLRAKKTAGYYVPEKSSSSFQFSVEPSLFPSAIFVEGTSPSFTFPSYKNPFAEIAPLPAPRKKLKVEKVQSEPEVAPKKKLTVNYAQPDPKPPRGLPDPLSAQPKEEIGIGGLLGMLFAGSVAAGVIGGIAKKRQVKNEEKRVIIKEEVPLEV